MADAHLDDPHDVESGLESVTKRSWRDARFKRRFPGIIRSYGDIDLRCRRGIQMIIALSA